MGKKKTRNQTLKQLTMGSSLAMSLALVACSSTQHPYDPQDPLQTINRGTFAFNQQVDRFILKPLATGYKEITPGPVRDSVNNFYWNLGEIPTTINNVLQFEPKAAVVSFGRLAINSTFGILGLFDVASHLGLHRRENDFGITLAKWGVTSSPYFVIPLLGPSNFRDGLALAVDYEYFSIWPYITSVRVRNILLGFDYVRIRANYLNHEDVLDAAALDRYTFVRDAYIQHRAQIIAEHGGHWDQVKYYQDSENAEDTDWAFGPETVTPPLKAESTEPEASTESAIKYNATPNNE